MSKIVYENLPSTNTPLNDTDLNEMQKMDIICATINNDYIIQNTGAYEQIPIDKIISVGNKLTLTNDGKIKIGNGISLILVSGKITVVSSGASTGGKNFVIRKNGANVNRGLFNQQHLTNKYNALPPVLVEVSENDLIDMAYYGTQGNKVAGGMEYTNLTVQAVD